MKWKEFFLFLVLIGLIINVKAKNLREYELGELIKEQWVSPDHISKLESLQVQDFQGRMKPMGTMSLELLRKVYKKNSFKYKSMNRGVEKLSASQVFIGMQHNPTVWKYIPIVNIEKKAIPIVSEVVEISKDGYAKPVSFYDENQNYVLKNWVEKAFSKSPGDRNAFDKTILNIDERVNVIWGIIAGKYFKVYPVQGNNKNKWVSPGEPKYKVAFADESYKNYMKSLYASRRANNWGKSNNLIQEIKKFQKENASSEVYLSKNKVRLELMYNRISPFFICLILYTMLGFVLLVLSFLNLFYKKKWLKIITITFSTMTILSFLFHGFGLGIRWYISGHAPWSNGYEATIFIAWIGMMSSIFYLKKNTFPLAAMSLISVCLLGIAHGNLMSPEVTNLVPVLKSYWLMIHVAIITGSYGFLTLGSVLALIVFVLSILLNNERKGIVLAQIKQITAINHVTTTIGLYMLTIGTFLGGIWANESWGRYWGWDPKETWALISIIIYAFILHVRLIFKKNTVLIYNIGSLLSLSSLVMTFFGVNYYLSGLHSYAKGDSFPIPTFVYVVIPIVLLIVLFGRMRYLKYHA